MDKNFLLSRQPVCRGKAEVVGYELRSHHPPAGVQADATDATRTIVEAFVEGALDDFIGAHPAHIGLTPHALVDEVWRRLPKRRVVLNFAEEFNPGDPVVPLLSEVVASGYRVALSDRLSRETLEAVSRMSPVIRVDITQYLPDQLRHRLSELRALKFPVLAGRVDTYDDFEFCSDLKFDLYQGSFLSKPALLRQAPPVNRVAAIRLLSLLQNPDTPAGQIEEAVSHDVALSFKLLRYANSTAVSLPRKVGSIGHAVRMVGMNTLRTWASVLLLGSVDDKPQELMTNALVRARMCEQLGKSLRAAEPETFFSVGLLSTLDALLDCPIEQAIAELPLNEEIRGALVERTGQSGQALRCAIAYENADWDEVQFYGLAAAPIREHYMEAVSWAKRMLAGLAGV